ncbi:hypothetical protein BaRGS_00011209 [Batillaria attramentaria]|uniref:Uncharacterized protein n=1 Tax=Batillaria attramentaria TaxID=370345 RepID=A0ABD0LDL9_9CAEN
MRRRKVDCTFILSIEKQSDEIRSRQFSSQTNPRVKIWPRRTARSAVTCLHWSLPGASNSRQADDVSYGPCPLSPLIGSCDFCRFVSVRFGDGIKSASVCGVTNQTPCNLREKGANGGCRL